MNKNLIMPFFKKFCLLSMLFMLAIPAQAGMVGNDEILHQHEQAQLTELLQQENVQQQLIELGVDPDAARARVDSMTEEEVAQLNGRLAELPAGAGLGTVEILLIIIIIILLV